MPHITSCVAIVPAMIAAAATVAVYELDVGGVQTKVDEWRAKQGKAGEPISLYSINVVKAQAALSYMGFYKAEIDGDFGPLTRSAIRAFQMKNFPGNLDEIDGELNTFLRQVPELKQKIE